ncbi:MAG: DNRLRE domain-containing protein [Candidatus Methylacidiphilales bacterium]|nr:DNRLRE domain-containing protein [Candidatus Methylacidiphilales bacterium]
MKAQLLFRRLLTTATSLAFGLVTSLQGQTPVALNVNWRADRKVNTSETYQLNIWDGVSSVTSANATYQSQLSSLNLGMVRVHAYTIYNQNEPEKLWVNYTTQTWDAAKIVSVYGNIRSRAGQVMQNIPNWPSWMDTNNDGRLDTGSSGSGGGTVDMRDTYAQFCADLVRILNITNSFNVKYWEPLNERDYAYDYAGGGTDLADIFNRCAVAMKAVDNSIVLGGPALQNPYPSSSQQANLDLWLNAVKPNLGFFSLHFYSTGGYNPASDYIYNQASNIGTRSTWARGLMKAKGYSPTIPIYVGETNIFSDGGVDSTTRYMPTILGANLLALICKSVGENPDAAGFQWFNDRNNDFGLINGYATYAIRSSRHMLYLANQHLVGTSVGTTSADTTRLNLYAVKNGNKKAVLFVNTSDITYAGTIGLQPGTDYVANVTFSENWVPTNSIYTVYTITDFVDATGTNNGVLTSATGTYTGGTLSLPCPARAIKMIVFEDVPNPNVISRFPVADTYVRSANPTTEYSTAPELRVYSTSTRSFLKFDLSNLGGNILSAKLKLYPVAVAGSSNVHRLELVGNNTWQENMTWNTPPPASSGTALATWSPAAALGGVNVIDITAAAQAAVANPDKLLSLLLASANSTDCRYGSNQALSDYRPELVVTRVPQPSSLVASADAYVNQTSPNANYATATETQVKLTGSGSDKECYYQFDLTGISSASQATLYLYPTSVDANNRANWLGLAPNNWTEAGITWNNRPGSSADIGTSFVPVIGQDVVRDVTTQVQAAIASGKVSFRVYSKNAGGLNRYGTKEQTLVDRRPQLDITP